jgi:hypothetical protein
MESSIKSLKEINGPHTPSSFSLKLNKNIFYNLILPFLTINDYKELLKVNKFFYNNIIKKNIEWITYLNDLKIKYNLEIPNNKIDFCKESAIKNQRYYKCNFDNSHYIKFISSGIEHISTFDKENWTWKNDSRYWSLKDSEESLFDEKIPSLIEVCWVDVNITMSKIPKGKFKLYIRHDVCNNNGNDLSLTIKANDKEIYKEKYPQKYMIEECKKNKEEKSENKEVDDDVSEEENVEEGKMANSFLIDIIFDKEENNIINLKFDHLNDNWKKNWDLDAIILTPIN